MKKQAYDIYCYYRDQQCPFIICIIIVIIIIILPWSKNPKG